MYGLLIQAGLEYLIATFGAEVAYEILDKAERIATLHAVEDLLANNEQAKRLATESKTQGRKFFMPHQMYSDKLLGRLATAASKKLRLPLDTVIESLGHFFVRYARLAGYESVLRMLGRHMRDFVMGLDNLHEYFKRTWPKMRAPSFVVLREDPDGMTICYRSPRGGFHAYVVGQLKEVAKSIFDTNIEVTVLSVKKETTTGRIAALMKLEFDNSHQFTFAHIEKNCTEEISGRLLKADVFTNLVPFFVAISRDLEIMSVGKGVRSVFPEIVGDPFFETFELIRPQIPNEWDSILENSYTVFEIHSLREIEVERDNDKKELIDTSGDELILRMRGQMVYFKEWDCIIYFAMPLLDSVKELNRTGLKINEMSKMDCSRDLLLLTHHKQVTTDSLKIKEAQVSAQINYMTKEMSIYKIKRQDIVEQVVPEPALINMGVYQTQLSSAAAVVCCHFVADKLTHIPGVHTRDIVSVMNMLFSRIDSIIAANKDICASAFTPTNDQIIICGPPGKPQVPAHCGIFIALEIAEHISDCVLVVKNEHEKENKESMSVSDSITAYRPTKIDLRLDVRIGIDVGPVYTQVMTCFDPPRFPVIGPAVVRAEAVAKQAHDGGIAWTSSVSRMLDDSTLRDNYVYEHREVQLPLGIFIEREVWLAIFRMKKVDREVLQNIVRPPRYSETSRSRAGSRASSMSSFTHRYNLNGTSSKPKTSITPALPPAKVEQLEFIQQQQKLLQLQQELQQQQLLHQQLQQQQQQQQQQPQHQVGFAGSTKADEGGGMVRGTPLPSGFIGKKTMAVANEKAQDIGSVSSIQSNMGSLTETQAGQCAPGGKCAIS